MDEELAFKQQRLGTSVEHRLGRDSLTYAVRDSSGAVEYTVKYETIIADQPYKLLVKNQLFFRNMMRLYAVTLVLPIALLTIHNNMATPALFIWATMLIVFYLSFSMNLLSIDYTMLKMNQLPPGMSDKAAIRIMNDKDGPRILSEIQTRWKARLRRLHSEINFSNDPNKEMAKFNWLKDHTVITDDEFREAVEKLQAMAASNRDRVLQSPLN